ncbi:general transcription factor IIH subunit 2-like [Artemia franciscana]|uniref:General transcription factor IIH subunit n=1 Tax=Artemia franciscana TaxID=6661 RepID=A0AA88HHX4_ARTSF|nr:hypothetical protein QYM36_013251 [Artemia franciscana]KAK2709521.1 hypothetical protein QYM36_013251 [Artemia franciscana]
MDEEESGYRWQSGYEKTWEALKETQEGALETSSIELAAKASRRQALLRKVGNVRLGIMRHMYIVIDASDCMSEQDLKPTRLRCTTKLLERFVDEYFDQNPISQLGIIVTKDKKAQKIIDLGSNQKKILDAIQKVHDLQCFGEPSLQNSIELVLDQLKGMPQHTSKEILIVFGSLTSCDPAEISETVQKLKKNGIRVSVIGLAAEVRICKYISRETNGDYGVIIDEHHFEQLIMTQIEPPIAGTTTESTLVKMGFPGSGKKIDIGLGEAQPDPSSMLAMCLCHLDDPFHCKISMSGYTCPQCGARYCDLPVECRICRLTLVSAPHLARSYHHLFPLPSFMEREKNDYDSSCNSCLKSFKAAEEEKYVYVCSKCDSIFCYDCDMFLHDTLHTCPGCAKYRECSGQTMED